MQITVNTSDKALSLGVEGDLTIYTAPELKDRLLLALGTTPGALELDLSRVSEIDTAGLQVLALCKRESLALQKDMRIVAHSQPLLDLLDLFNLTGYFGDPVIITDREKR